MYEYVGILMSTKIDSNGYQFTKEVLENIVAEQPKVPVRVNFSGKSIGSTKFFELMENSEQLLCHFEIEYPGMDQLGLYIVPGSMVDVRDIKKTDTGGVTLNKIKLTEVSLTTMPADQSLTKIENKELY